MPIRLLCLILFAVFSGSQALASTLPATFTVAARTLQQQVTVFGQVTPQHLYQATSSLGGRLAHLSLKPGESVHEGDLVADLTGSDVTERIQAADETVNQAQTDAASAKALLTLTQQKRSQTLATQQDVLKARMALTQAQAQLAVAKSRQQALATETRLLSPVTGKVLTVSAADGDYVSAGQSILKILPASGLWLSARAYGRDGKQMQVGQTGLFHPDDGGAAIPVTVTSTAPDPDTPGIWHLYLTPTTQAPNWFAGEAGKLVLEGDARQLPAVPSAALIMDQGKWWVMLKTERGVQAVQVSPAATLNGWTWLKQGLSAGQKILVRDAYQRFHRDFASQYANPD